MNTLGWIKKTVLILSADVFLLVGCEYRHTGVESTYDIKEVTAAKIEFKVTAKPEDADICEEDICPWVELVNPESEIVRLRDADETVVHRQEVILIIDYPIKTPVEFKLHTTNGKGFTRVDLIRAIGEKYRMIYDEEEKTATIKTIPVERRKRSLNRNQTNGKYGIWGHDLQDLALSSIQVIEKNDEYYLKLKIESLL